MTKRSITIILCSLLLLSFLPSSVRAESDDSEVNENSEWNQLVLAKGEDSTGDKEDKLFEIFGVEKDDVEIIEVASTDISKYTDRSPGIFSYSSTLIEKKNKGYGVKVSVLTPDDITSVTKEQYKNALVTAGAKDVHAYIATPTSVTGTAALTGIYKVFDEKGEAFNQDRVDLAETEIDTLVDINEAHEDDADYKAATLDKVLLQIKTDIAEADKDLDKKALETIVKEALSAEKHDNILDDDEVTSLVDLAILYEDSDMFEDDTWKEQLKGDGDQEDETAKKPAPKTDTSDADLPIDIDAFLSTLATMLKYILPVAHE